MRCSHPSRCPGTDLYLDWQGVWASEQGHRDFQDHKRTSIRPNTKKAQSPVHRVQQDLIPPRIWRRKYPNENEEKRVYLQNRKAYQVLFWPQPEGMTHDLLKKQKQIYKIHEKLSHPLQHHVHLFFLELAIREAQGLSEPATWNRGTCCFSSATLKSKTSSLLEAERR